MYRLAINSAKHSIKISSSYFVPDPGTVKALAQAARRGVRVQIIIPGKYQDSAIVKASSPALWGELLKAGVEIHRYQPTMYHCKVLIVDDAFASVGSTNFDNRSFQLNDEVNLNVFDEAFAAQQGSDLRRRSHTLEAVHLRRLAGSSLVSEVRELARPGFSARSLGALLYATRARGPRAGVRSERRRST
jgi:phosphatidylserine/phosphatidylglycerophosphate/cardiolipin synthase-like enzyme